MAIVISVSSLKGGSGKTTTVQSLAAALTLKANRCLVIDLDPQRNLSFTSDVEVNRYTIYELMKGECSFEDAYQVNEYYDIIPADMFLSEAEQKFTGEGKEYILRNVLEQIREKYDYIIIDTPPGYSILNINSLTASDYVIMTAEQSFYSLQGLEMLNIMVQEVQEEYNKNLKILGVLIVKLKEKAAINQFLIGLIDRFVDEYKIRLFDTVIHESSAVCFAQGMKQNIIEFDAKNIVSRDYKMLAKELEPRDNIIRNIV